MARTLKLALLFCWSAAVATLRGSVDQAFQPLRGNSILTPVVALASDRDSNKTGKTTATGKSGKSAKSWSQAREDLKEEVKGIYAKARSGARTGGPGANSLMFKFFYLKFTGIANAVFGDMKEDTEEKQRDALAMGLPIFAHGVKTAVNIYQGSPKEIPEELSVTLADTFGRAKDEFDLQFQALGGRAISPEAMGGLIEMRCRVELHSVLEYVNYWVTLRKIKSDLEVLDAAAKQEGVDVATKMLLLKAQLEKMGKKAGAAWKATNPADHTPALKAVRAETEELVKNVNLTVDKTSAHDTRPTYEQFQEALFGKDGGESIKKGLSGISLDLWNASLEAFPQVLNAFGQQNYNRVYKLQKFFADAVMVKEILTQKEQQELSGENTKPIGEVCLRRTKGLGEKYGTKNKNNDMGIKGDGLGEKVVDEFLEIAKIFFFMESVRVWNATKTPANFFPVTVAFDELTEADQHAETTVGKKNMTLKKLFDSLTVTTWDEHVKSEEAKKAVAAASNPQSNQTPADRKKQSPAPTANTQGNDSQGDEKKNTEQDANENTGEASPENNSKVEEEEKTEEEKSVSDEPKDPSAEENNENNDPEDHPSAGEKLASQMDEPSVESVECPTCNNRLDECACSDGSNDIGGDGLDPGCEKCINPVAQCTCEGGATGGGGGNGPNGPNGRGPPRGPRGPSNGGGGNGPDDDNSNNNPKTWLWILLACVGGAGVIGVVVYIRCCGKKEDTADDVV